jgi:hypothetical protein
LTERLVIAVVVVAVAALVAVVLERRRPEPPTQGRWSAPTQLDRSDFDRPDAPWLVVVFSSATCSTCAQALAKAQALASDEVAVQEAEVKARPDLHRRYSIDAVPITVVADAEGVVRRSFVGPATATDLWAGVAEVRGDGQSSPPGAR